MSAWCVMPEHIAAMNQAMLDQGYAGTSINRGIADVAGAYSWAIKNRHCPEGYLNPCREFERLPEKLRRVELSNEDVSAILAGSKISRWPKLYALVICAMHSGARKGELLALRWADVDTRERRAMLHETKSGQPRRLLLTEPASAALEAIRPCPCPDDALIFSGRNPFKAHNFRKAWEACRALAGLPELHFHDLRHNAAATLLKSGRFSQPSHCIR